MTIRFNRITNDKNNKKNMFAHINSTKEDLIMGRQYFSQQATTKAIYRKELEKFKKYKKILIEAEISKISSKFVDSDFGGYKIKTMCLKDVKLILRSKTDNKLKVFGYIDHIWINEETNTVVRDKNNEVGDTVRFYAYITEYKYSHGMNQLGLGQVGKIHKNITKGFTFKSNK